MVSPESGKAPSFDVMLVVLDYDALKRLEAWELKHC